MNRPRLSDISWRVVHVWRRDLLVYRRIWKVNFLVPMLEPVFYLLAFGLGFSGLIGQVDYAGHALRYIDFMAPALVATAVMWNAFFETTYASFVRMYYQKTFDGILATPISLEEIILAEIAWSATKSAAAVALMLAVLMPLGFVAFPSGLLILPVAFLGGLAFGAVGMFFTGIIPTIDMFNLPIFLFITPMFLFSGTFFPLSNIPGWAKTLSFLLPLYQQVEATRLLALGFAETSLWFSLLYLLAFFLFFAYLGLWAMRRRLIR